MNKIDVLATIRDAYRFTFTQLGAIIGLISLHLYLVIRLGVASPPWSKEAAGKGPLNPSSNGNGNGNGNGSGALHPDVLATAEKGAPDG